MAGILDALAETWPARMGRGILSAAMLPGDVWAGRAGTSNYVLFRDDIIDILRKYGLAGMLGAGAATQSATPEQSQ